MTLRSTSIPGLWSAAWLAIAGHAAMSAMNAFARMGVPSAGPGAVAFMRFAVAAAILYAIWRNFGGRLPERRQLRLHAMRGALISIGAICYFQAMAILPLAQATALTFAAPLLAQPIGMLRLGEYPSAREWYALLLGALGVCISSWSAFQTGGTAVLGVAWAAAGVIATAMHTVLLRERAGTDGAITTAMLASSFPAVLSAPFAISLTWIAVVTGALAGVFGALGMALAAKAAATARLASLSVYEFSKLPLAIAMGWLTASEVPGVLTCCGGTLAMLACYVTKSRPVQQKETALTPEQPHAAAT